MIRRLALAAVALLVLSGERAPAAQRGSSGTIVFAADRAPLWNGEVYRLGLDGRLTDLSRSPALDSSPAVSPDGRLVAFASDRTGRLALYVVGIDGGGLRRVSPFFFSSASIQGYVQWGRIAWSPDGRELAAVLSASSSVAWVGDLRGAGRTIPPRPSAIDSFAWSPDGRELAALEPAVAEVDVRTPAGRLLWSAPADSAGWSARGRLAVRRGETVSVYDGRGRRLASFAAGAFAWSPDGSLLASQHGRAIQIRRGGIGRAVRAVLLLTPTQGRQTGGGANGSSGIEWLAGGKLRVDDGNGWAGLDATSGRPWTPPRPFAALEYPPVVSADGRRLAVARPSSSATTPIALRVASLDGRVGPVLRTVPPCPDTTPFASLQFTPGGRALVYASGCPDPPADLYAVAPGGKPRRLTRTVAHETDPVPSPDGAQIAYVRAASTDCRGCPTSIWLMRADGTGRHALTNAPDSTWDSDPTWSPDGKEILFWHSTISTPGYLGEIPAAGGPVTRLPLAGIYPAWGPSRIAFVGPRTELVRTARPDGSDPVTVARDTAFVPHTLAWSRSGRLAFLDTGKDGLLRLVVVAGTALVRRPLGLAPAPIASGLAWSPDGTRLALVARDAAGVVDVWTVAPDGSRLERATTGFGAAGGGLGWR